MFPFCVKRRLKRKQTLRCFCIEKAHHSNERPPKHDRSELAWSLFLAKLLYKAQWYGKELICIESEEIETELSFSESTENSEYLRSQKS